jgi:RNA polymerase-binding transcription factor DksA
MPRHERASQQAMTQVLPRGADGPHWRAVLEARWQLRVREVTELSLAYHTAVAAAPDDDGAGAGRPEIRVLLTRTVAVRRQLANVEEALDRLAAGNFGCCEQCESWIPAGLLAIAPETRYCPRCAPDLAWAEAGHSRR